MNFYSIYRIIKDIFQTIFGRKFFRKLLIILLVFIIMFTIYSRCFAAQANTNTTSVTDVYDGLVAGLCDTLNNNTDSDKAMLLRVMNNYDYYITNSTGTWGSGSSDYSWGTPVIYYVYVSVPSLSATTSSYTTYNGVSCTWYYFGGSATYCFTVSSTSINYSTSVSMTSISAPSQLVGYSSPVFTNWYSTYKADTATQTQTNTIISQSEASQATITNSTVEITNTITSTNYDENDVSIDTSVADDVDSTEIDGYFTRLFGYFSDLLNEDWSTAETISIPIKDYSLELSSDAISSHVSGTFIYSIIQVAYFAVFGLYGFKFVNYIIHQIKSGDIMNSFNFNEVITSDMM